MKTTKEVLDEIAALRRLLQHPNFPKRTLFGEDTVEMVEAQIEVLEKTEDFDQVEGRRESGEWDDRVCSAAQDAIRWRDDGGESPSAGFAWVFEGTPVAGKKATKKATKKGAR